MTLRNFLKLHVGGVSLSCVSIHQEPYTGTKHGYEETYFEEVSQDEIIASDIFRQIANKQVDHFNIIGGGMYKVELCIYLQEEN